MVGIFFKEINTFLSSLIGYIVIAAFLLFVGLMMFVFPDTSLLEYRYAGLDQLFDLTPTVFLFLIPAITMRSFSEEFQTGTIEMLVTRPLREMEIVGGKFLACVSLIIFALLPTLLYYYTVYQLGSPKGNIDSGAVLGSYLGMVFLGSAFAAIGLFASSITRNQVTAFIVATFLCFLFFWGFFYFSKLPVFVGKWDDIIQMAGIDFHYNSISKGVIDSRDLVYFFSITGLFLMLTLLSLESRKW